MIELFTSVWDMTIAIKSSVRRQTLATLLRKHSSQPFRAQAPLADQNSGRAIASPATSLALMLRVSVPYKGNRRGRKDY